LLEEFGGAFFLADRVIVTDIYAAGETRLNGISGSVVADALVRHGHPAVTYQPDMAAIPAVLRELLQPGDIVVTLGAGDVWKLGDELVRSAKPRRKTKRARTRS
jgi:UDP-N-acetylmuramate--alanine ligase